MSNGNSHTQYDKEKARREWIAWKTEQFLERGPDCGCPTCIIRKALEDESVTDVNAFGVWGYPVMVIPLDSWKEFFDSKHKK